MNIDEYKKNLKTPLKQGTLCFLLRNDEILLSVKKRGFGKGKTVGAGGKVEKNEIVDAAAIREVKEELGVVVQDLKRVATLDFYFPFVEKPENWNLQVVAYLSKKWTGEIKESDELLPAWVNKYKIPYDKMWADSTHWVPYVLDGYLLKGEFLYDKELKIPEYNLFFGSY
ncbi:8-oxo-dGTP diphosphatase [Candidatus Woesearchaeota archaeon]|nr:8-oxo-dGTP diphosphatase [Candidatus Woesearchaeota archaeon]